MVKTGSGASLQLHLYLGPRVGPVNGENVCFAFGSENSIVVFVLKPSVCYCLSRRRRRRRCRQASSTSLQVCSSKCDAYPRQVRARALLTYDYLLKNKVSKQRHLYKAKALQRPDSNLEALQRRSCA